MVEDTELKEIVHRYLIQKTDFLKVKDTMNEDQLRVYVDKSITDVCYEEQMEITMEQRIRLIREMVGAVVALGPLRPLMEDKEITEIMVNGAHQIYIQRKGRIDLSDVKFEHNEHLTHTIQKLLNSSGTNRRVDESNPYVDFPLPDGTRCNVILPPCSLVGPVMTIRKFADISTIDDVLRLKMLDQDIATFLCGTMLAKHNIVFCGATGTGKTTLLNVLSRHIDDEERIITIEDTPELRLKQDHVVTLQAKMANVEGKGAISIRDLFVNSLRMRPDRLIIGEVRSDEMLDLIESIASGHSGSLAIVHAESPEDCFSRMTTMMLMTGIKLDTRIIEKQIGRAIDLIVHIILYPDGVRRVTNVTDVSWDDEREKPVMKDIFTFKQDSISAEGKISGHWEFNRETPAAYEKFKKKNIKLPEGFFNKM